MSGKSKISTLLGVRVRLAYNELTITAVMISLSLSSFVMQISASQLTTLETHSVSLRCKQS